MVKQVVLAICFSFLFAHGLWSQQQVVNSTLIKADKLFIRHDYGAAVTHYVKYLKDYPKDYYASRQAAICYDRLNNPNDAIDYWPVAVESSEVTEKDYLQFARCLLANNREPEARKVFVLLSHSTDKSIASWGKAYLNPAAFYTDSALCKVVELNGVNTDKSEFCPLIYKGKLFWVFDKGKTLRIYNAITDLETQTISAAIKKDSATFFPAMVNESLQTRNVNSQFCFTPDGNTFYFSKAVSSKDMKVKSENPFWKFQLFSINLTSMDAGNHIYSFKYNSADYDIMHPSISSDGKKLYFSSDMKGSAGGKDIFVCEWENGDWGAPKNVGPQVNSPGNEVFPHISEEGALYFSSDARPGLGGLDIFCSEPADSSGSAFKEAKNSGGNMNTRFDDFGIYLLKDGKSGYFSSNRKNNTDDDIYFFVNVRPE